MKSARRNNVEGQSRIAPARRGQSHPRIKSLEALARSVKDSDQFVNHVCNVAAAYGKHAAFDGAASRDVRHALRSLAKHAEALSQWLQSAARSGSSSIEGQALRQLSVSTRNPGSVGQSIGMRAWLAQVAQASSAAAEAAPAEARADALRGAAEGLRATFERHHIKLSQRAPQQKQSDAVRLLCALVIASGAAEIEPAEASQCFKAVRAKPIPSGRAVKADRSTRLPATRLTGKGRGK
jgi:hypothetical protein